MDKDMADSACVASVGSRKLMSIEQYLTKRTKTYLSEVSLRIYEHSMCLRVAVDIMPLFENVFSGEVVLSVLEFFRVV